jgi:hypothetical protein
MGHYLKHAEYPLLSVRENFSPDTYADCCPIRTVVYPRILNRQRRAARQLLLVEDNGPRWHGWWLPTSLLKITHCHCLHYCVGNGIMPARSNSSSRRDLSAMYPGVKSVVWRSDAIPLVSLDVFKDNYMYTEIQSSNSSIQPHSPLILLFDRGVFNYWWQCERLNTMSPMPPNTRIGDGDDMTRGRCGLWKARTILPEDDMSGHRFYGLTGDILLDHSVGSLSFGTSYNKTIWRVRISIHGQRYPMTDWIPCWPIGRVTTQAQTA